MSSNLSSDERNWAMIAHLCGLLWLVGSSSLVFVPFGLLALFTMIGPYIIMRTKGKTMPFVLEQARESLNFQVTVFLIGLLCIPLVFLLIGIPMLWILGLINLILVVIAAINVSDGKPYRYPFCLRLFH
jgi:uncharacterized protein